MLPLRYSDLDAFCERRATATHSRRQLLACLVPLPIVTAESGAPMQKDVLYRKWRVFALHWAFPRNPMAKAAVCTDRSPVKCIDFAILA